MRSGTKPAVPGGAGSRRLEALGAVDLPAKSGSLEESWESYEKEKSSGRASKNQEDTVSIFSLVFAVDWDVKYSVVAVQPILARATQVSEVYRLQTEPEWIKLYRCQLSLNSFFDALFLFCHAFSTESHHHHHGFTASPARAARQAMRRQLLRRHQRPWTSPPSRSPGASGILSGRAGRYDYMMLKAMGPLQKFLVFDMLFNHVVTVIVPCFASFFGLRLHFYAALHRMWS